MCVAVSLILKVSLHLAVCRHTETDSVVGAHELKLPPRYDIVNAAATADFNLGRVCMLQ